MKPADIASLKTKIDTALVGAPLNHGVGFGDQAYMEFWHAGHIELATFVESTTGGYPLKLPAYAGRYAFCHGGLDPVEAQIAGNPPVKP